MYLLYYNSTTTGFEPVRQFANGFRVRLLNHSDKLPLVEKLGIDPSTSRMLSVRSTI